MRCVNVRLVISIIKFKKDLFSVLREIIIFFTKYLQNGLGCFILSEIQRCFSFSDHLIRVSSVLVVLKLGVHVMKHAGEIG